MRVIDPFTDRQPGAGLKDGGLIFDVSGSGLYCKNAAGTSNTAQIQALEQLRSDAVKKDGNRLLQGLKARGKWIADAASKIGVNYICEILKEHLPK